MKTIIEQLKIQAVEIGKEVEKTNMKFYNNTNPSEDLISMKRKLDTAFEEIQSAIGNLVAAEYHGLHC